ncbi:hypothetical protein C8R45DRAFT_1113394 [Mycena sanguinolenta]|nr:hypothetical protein C8R45DRAFT_1113394 [Mycena sanguinolenta]
MPASRRTSASEHDEELAGHLQGLSMAGERASPGLVPVSASILTRGSSRYVVDEGARYASTYNAGMMLDEQLDQEMHNAMRNLPTSDDDKYNSFAGNKVSTSSAALDLVHISQTSPRASFATRTLETRDKSSEWPQFAGSGWAPAHDGVLRADRRTMTNPNLTVPLRPTTLHPQLGSHAQLPTSRRGSPPSLLESLNSTTRSVPATPLGIPNSAVHILKSPDTPHTPETQGLNGRLASVGESAVNAGDVQASLSRLLSGQYDGGSLTFNSIQPGGLDDTLQQQYGGGMDSVYGLNGLDSNGYNSRNLDGNPRFYRAHNSGAGNGKINGLYGPKHKRGDMDREFNRFAGTRLEDLQDEIPALCKDQHSCRYLPKKLEVGSTEHGDMIFRGTFGHFADRILCGSYDRFLLELPLPQTLVICEPKAWYPRAAATCLHFNGLSDIYAGQGGLYGQLSFGQTHIGQHHSPGPSSINGYVLQGNSSHIGLTSSHHAGGLSGASFAGISPVSGAGLTTSLSGDPYQGRSADTGYDAQTTELSSS